MSMSMRLRDDVPVASGWQIQTDAYREKVLEIAQSSPRYAGAELRYETRELLCSESASRPRRWSP